MAKDIKHSCWLLVVCLLSLVLAACSGPKETAGSGKRIQETYYYDANLEFALEHPRKWERKRVAAERYPGIPYAIRLSPQAKKGTASPASVVITSIPPTLARGGYAALQQSFLETTPGFSIDSEKQVSLTYTPAWLVEGKAGDRSFLVYLVTSNRRAYIIEISAPASVFEDFRLIFEDLARSFLPLD